MPDWRVTVDSSDAGRRIERLALFLSDLRSFWPRVVPLFISWQRRNFESEGAFMGQRWAPLSPGYAAFKAQARPGRTILIFDGDMRRAASQPARNATSRSLTLTIDDEKAGFHQEGTTKMPARPLIPDRLPAIALAELQDAASDYVGDILHRL